MNTTYDLRITRRLKKNGSLISTSLLDNISNVGIARSDIIRLAGRLVDYEGCTVIGISSMAINLRSADDSETITVEYRNNHED